MGTALCKKCRASTRQDSLDLNGGVCLKCWNEAYVQAAEKVVSAAREMPGPPGALRKLQAALVAFDKIANAGGIS